MLAGQQLALGGHGCLRFLTQTICNGANQDQQLFLQARGLVLGVQGRQFMQAPQDGGLRAGIAEFNAHRINARPDAAGEQGVPRDFDHRPIYTAACHGVTPDDFVLSYGVWKYACTGAWRYWSELMD
ncbi:hypothetical protein FQZ97_1060440 [compost metagenome]